MHFEVIVNQILILAFLALIGYSATKLKVINNEVKNSIAKIVFNITLPLLILISVSSITITKQILTNGTFVFVFSLVGIFLLITTGKLSAKFLGLKSSKKNIHILHTGFGNIAFLGYPLFSALFPGGEGLLYAIIFHFSQDIIMWSYGIFIFNSTKGLSFKSNLKHLINPNTVAFIIGSLMLVFGLKIPELIYNPLYGLGHTTIYLAMLYIGAMLAQNTMLHAFKNKSIYLLGFNKLIFIPIVLLMIINAIIFLLDLQIGNIAKTVVIMQTGMPCMALIVVLAKEYNSDDLLATENLFLSTIFSLFTLPFIYYIIQYF
ncbi:MAG: AEC family transporter [Bacteroidales bacterium]|jgi:predicted permease|nr:AEC family transporter [Bacteroidales bacterium]